jgi:hypothetical protein
MGLLRRKWGDSVSVGPYVFKKSRLLVWDLVYTTIRIENLRLRSLKLQLNLRWLARSWDGPTVLPLKVQGAVWQLASNMQHAGIDIDAA